MVIELSPPGLLYVAFRQRRVITLFVLLGFGLTALFCLWATSRYEADASVVVTFNRQLTGTSNEQGAGTPPNPAAADEVVNSYALVLQSNALATKVINEVGIERMYPSLMHPGLFGYVIGGIQRLLGRATSPLEAAVDRFVNRDTNVEVAKESTIIRISLYNPDPQVAVDALKVLVDRFLQQQALIGRDPQKSFVQSQVEIYRKRVADAQNAMEAFQLKNRIFSLDEENSYLLKQRSDLEAQLANTAVQIEQDHHKIDALNQQLKTLRETVSLHQEDRDAALDAARTQLVTLQVRLEQLSTSFGPDSPAVRITNEEIAKVEDFIKTYPSRTPLVQNAPNPTYEFTQSSLLQAKADLDTATKSKPAIEQQIDDISARLAEHAREQATYQDLVREYQIDDENYRNYLQAVQEARIAEDLNKEKATSVALYDPAYLASSLPAKPRRTLLMLAGTFLGILFGFTAAFLREYWDERVNTPRQVQSLLGVPVLGSSRNFLTQSAPQSS